MAISDKKRKTPEPDFEINDCQRVIEIYENGAKRTLTKPVDTEAMLNAFRLFLGIYRIAQSRDEAPTPAQLRKQHTDIKSKTRNLLVDLQEKTDEHFLNSLVSAMAGTKTPIAIDSEKYLRMMSDIYERLGDLGKSLKWLDDNLSLCTNEKFEYLHCRRNPNARSPAENQFVTKLGLVLTKYLGKGGYAFDSCQDEYSGWKIDCVAYLLKRVGAKRTRGQIFAVLNSYQRKKTDNKISK